MHLLLIRYGVCGTLGLLLANIRGYLLSEDDSYRQNLEQLKIKISSDFH
ncbi:MAG: hypothetical protein RPR97_07490 [Colwellia sp.]